MAYWDTGVAGWGTAIISTLYSRYICMLGLGMSQCLGIK